MTGAALLNIDHLRVELRGPDGLTDVVLDVSLRINRGEAVGLVGESGSGKSMTARSVMRLLPEGALTHGRIEVDGADVTAMSRSSLSAFRSHDVGMIFQDPRAHVNPVWTIEDFLVESVVATRQMTRPAAVERAIGLLAEVGIPDGPRRLRQYPHQLSGGLLQRIMIVMTLMPGPKLLLADEPTTALDVTVQAEVMAILNDLRVDHGLGLLFITHDLDLAAAVCDALAVMYAGTVIERGQAASIVGKPRHPYTAALLGARPDPEKVQRLTTIPGRPAAASEVGPGCVFERRCPFATDLCRAERPPMRSVDGGEVACHYAEDLVDELQGLAG